MYGRIEEAKELINQFCMLEYNCKADFTDLGKIGVAYSETDDYDSLPIEVFVNLWDYRTEYYVAAELVYTDQAKTFQEYVDDYLSCMSFDDMINDAQDAYNEMREKK